MKFLCCFPGYSESFAGKKIVLFEAAPDRGDFKLPKNYSNRTCALSPATSQLLSSRFLVFPKFYSLTLN